MIKSNYYIGKDGIYYKRSNGIKEVWIGTWLQKVIFDSGVKRLYARMKRKGIL